MRRRLLSQRGQTASEYMGMLLVVAMVIVALDSTGVASQIADAVEREICRVATGETCGKDAASDRRRSEPRRRPAERLKLRETRRVSRDLALGVPVRRMPRAQTSNIWKKVACKAAGVLAAGVNVATGTSYAVDIVDAICDGIKKGIRYVEGKVAPVVQKMCKASANVCKTVIEKVCGALKKIDRRACDVVKKAACFATDLDLFCTKAQKRHKLDVRRREARVRELRGQRTIDIPGGSMRMFGRDRLGRATGARADVSPRTVRERAARRNEGRPNTNDVTGWKPGCEPRLHRGHLIARSLGGPGNDPRNLVPLPPGFNQGAMQTVEREILDAVREGRTLKVDVRPAYPGRNPTPTTITFRVRTIRADEGLPDFSIDRTLDVPPAPSGRC